MKSTLIDAGPIIALFDSSDAWHGRALSFLKSYEGRLITTWPVITEASHFLDFNVEVQADLLRWISRGALILFDLDEVAVERLIELTCKYRDVPMDLADASLVVAAERLGLRQIISIDSDFDAYRALKRDYITNIFG